MSYPLNLTIPASPALVSSQYVLDYAHRPVAFHSASYGTAARLYTQWAAQSGGPFGTLTRFDGSGAEFTCASGAGNPAVSVIEYPPSPLFRLALSSAQTAVVSVFAVSLFR